MNNLELVDQRRRAIILEDNEADAESLSRLLENLDYDLILKVVENSEELARELQINSVLVVFIDYYVGMEIGTDIIERMKLDYPLLPFILLTGRGDETVASEALRVGAKDYLKKDDLSEPLLNKILLNIFIYWEQEEKILKQSRLLHQQAAIINSTSDSVIHANLDGEIVFMNQAAQLLFGSSYGDVKDVESFAERLSDSSGYVFLQTVVPNLNKERRWEGEFCLIEESGDHLPISMNIFSTH